MYFIIISSIYNIKIMCYFYVIYICEIRTYLPCIYIWEHFVVFFDVVTYLMPMLTVLHNAWICEYTQFEVY